MRRFRPFRNIRIGYLEAVRRWRAKTPIVFSRVIKIALGVSGTAGAVQLALNAGNASEPDWWTACYPYLIGIPAGMAFISKFTQNYDEHGKPVRKKKKQSED